MRWSHAVILALGIACAGLFTGGIFEFDTSSEDYVVRLNRLTGAVSFQAPPGGHPTSLTMRSLDPISAARRARR